MRSVTCRRKSVFLAVFLMGTFRDGLCFPRRSPFAGRRFGARKSHENRLPPPSHFCCQKRDHSSKCVPSHVRIIEHCEVTLFVLHVLHDQSGKRWTRRSTADLIIAPAIIQFQKEEFCNCGGTSSRGRFHHASRAPKRSPRKGGFLAELCSTYFLGSIVGPG